MAEPNDREPGTRPDGEADSPQVIDPRPDGKDEMEEERPQADPEVPALGEWDKRRGPDPRTDATGF